MSKKSLIERQKKRIFLVKKYFSKRQKLKKQINQQKLISKKFQFQHKLQKLPRDSSRVRLHNRCLFSGRPKGFFRNFKISRHYIREMALLGYLPGIKKASW